MSKRSPKGHGEKKGSVLDFVRSEEVSKITGEKEHRVPEGIYASPQQGGLRLLGPPSGQGAGGGARTRVRRVPADLRSNS
ncbi:hypothetical protein PoB_006292100 [Plakobranchus ocellatus]|uniref:Uncharacterized protein n=1 Tax=Plakobranchus ocellatus TaxID=259542 RepID=A0AAV4CX04_9GAST|nr:hypothetical protein PoB_006292100 [Plakobranchus ocellatus]